MAPRTFRELLALEEWQETSGFRCKCGIETRDYVSRNYGGYFYSWEPGELEHMTYESEDAERQNCYVIDDRAALMMGKQKYAKIVDAMDEIAIEDGPIPVILKRGCTEFEQNCGPTDLPQYRNITPQQIALEKALDDNVEYTPGQFVATQPDALKDAVRMRWAHFAHSRGDMTYIEWLGHALSVPPVVYHK